MKFFAPLQETLDYIQSMIIKNLRYFLLIAAINSLVACGGGSGGSPNLGSGQMIGNLATPDGSIQAAGGSSLTISAIADTRGPGLTSHKWTVAPKSDSALRAKAPTIQNADCANAVTSRKPIAGGAVIIAQSKCDSWMVVPVTAVDAIWRITSTATGTDGTTSSDSFDLVVKALPLPVFDITATSSENPTLDKAVFLNGVATVGAPTIGKVKFAWTQLAGPTVTLGGAELAKATFVPSTPGEYVFLLTGTWEIDDTSRIETDIVHFRVNSIQPSEFDFKVFAEADPVAPSSATPVTLRAKFTTRPGAPVDSITYKWTKLFGPDSTTTATTNQSIVVAPEIPGRYVWAVEATLKSGTYTETQTAHAKFEVGIP